MSGCVEVQHTYIQTVKNAQCMQAIKMNKVRERQASKAQDSWKRNTTKGT